MKKATLSFVIAAVIASNVNVSNAATITGVFKGTQNTNPGATGDFFISGEEGINYDFDKANTGLTNAQKDIIQAQKDIAANAGNVAGKADQTALTAEVNRATGAEAGLDSRVTSVEGFAGAINATVHQQAIADIQRDKTIAGNTQAVATEAATRTAQVQKLDSDITGETTRAKAAEGANAAAITTETQRATGAEQANASGIQTNAAAISTEATRAAAVEQANVGALLKEQARATYAESNNEQHINANANRISADEQTEAGHFKTLQTAVDQKVDTGTFQQRAADVDQRIAERKAAQQKTDAVVSRHSAELADHETRIESLEANTSANFGKLKSQVEENRKRASAGIAGVSAMANIPQVIQGQTFSIGAGVGTADSQQALAVGFSARATENTVVKASVSNDSQHNFVAGAGLSYGW